MFFYVKDQLVEFSKRLRRFKIHIYSYDKDAKDLPTVLRSDISSPKTFDRIETSNITDKNYVGLSILSHWGPLLNGANPHAAIIGLFMNWTTWKKAGEATSSMATMHRAMKEMASCKFTVNTLPQSAHTNSRDSVIGLTPCVWSFFAQCHEWPGCLPRYLNRIPRIPE